MNKNYLKNPDKKLHFESRTQCTYLQNESIRNDKTVSLILHLIPKYIG